MSGLNWDKAARRDAGLGVARARREGQQAERRQKREKPATPKQIGYIAALAKRLGITPPAVSTTAGASAAINELKRRADAQERRAAADGAK